MSRMRTTGREPATIDETAVALAQALDAADDHAEGRRVDEGHPREVDHDGLDAGLDERDEVVFEARRGVEVDLAGELDQTYVGLQQRTLCSEIGHLASIISRRAAPLRIGSRAWRSAMASP